jgi:FAD synthase
MENTNNVAPNTTVRNNFPTANLDYPGNVIMTFSAGQYIMENTNNVAPNTTVRNNFPTANLDYPGNVIVDFSAVYNGKHEQCCT